MGDKVKRSLRYLYMGILGCGLYLVILQILLRIQGKELDTYQGINGMGTALGANSGGMVATIVSMYRDFFAFTLKGHILWNNIYSLVAWVVLVLATVTVFFFACRNQKWWRHPWFYLIVAALMVVLPLVTNVILIISPDVTYHLLMRYQWVLYPILLMAFAEKCGKHCKWTSGIQWMLLCAAFVIVFNYGITDNIAYSNLEKRYEKTYAYCVRLLDRIEQTEGYYQGIPIAMIGVVGDEEFPLTDLTGKVTDGMIGMSGDNLLYTGYNYQSFMQNYLGATLNFLPAEAMEEIYYSEEYRNMDSFPGPNSTKVVDGILYVHTENVDREAE